MLILVACEMSGRVRDAFRSKGHEAYSCDLLPDMNNNYEHHFKMDVFEAFDLIYNHHRAPDLVIAFPPCTHLASSGAAWFKNKVTQQADAIDFVKTLWSLPIDKMCIENPVGVLSTKWMKPTQYIHPWQHGHGETKKTCLWLRGLPPLQPTNIVDGREPRIHMMSPSKDRAMLRSLTYPGIARAMAHQWS